MTSPTEALDRLAPTQPWEGDWADVLRRAGGDRRPLAVPGRVRRRRLGRRRFVLLAIAAAAVIAPLTALAAINHWWFLRTSLPRPTQRPVVITRGSWSGHRWTLVAYPSHGYGLCYGVTFDGGQTPSGSATAWSLSSGMAQHGADDGVGCGSIVGIQMPHLVTKNIPTVMWESETTNAPGYPSWISGAVVASATHVVVRWSAKAAKPSEHRLGSPPEVVRAATFTVPIRGYHVRLFAIPIPTPVSRQTRTASTWTDPSSISGANDHGRVVACFNARISSTNGVYPLSECKP